MEQKILAYQNQQVILYLSSSNPSNSLIFYQIMKKASNYTYLRKRGGEKKEQEMQDQAEVKPGFFANIFGGSSNKMSVPPPPKEQSDLNVFVLTFDEMKKAEQNLAGGDPYECKKCRAVLNKFSVVLNRKQFQEQKKNPDLQFGLNESYWQCEFCTYPNILQIEKEQVPLKDDIVYMLESELQKEETENDATMIFCIDVSGSMNTTSEIKGKVDLKFGLSQQEIEMLKQFMEPGDEAQFNFLPGAHNKDKTFISRKQCILSAIENQLLELKKIDPHKRIGFILFNNQVVVCGDGKTETVHIVGDKLNKKEEIILSLNNFKLNSPLNESFEGLIHQLNKTEAKGQTALGPALISAIEVAGKGSLGSTVILCTDGLANIGIGALDQIDEEKKKFYQDLANLAKEKNIVVNIMTIKGQGCKVEIIGKLAEYTNGNVKVVNPEKLADDFANVLKDEVVGLNVTAKIMLHKAMIFRNEEEAFLKDNKTILVKEFANATTKTKVSFEYEVREEEDLKFMEIKLEDLKKVPFQAQITYTNPKGGKYLRVISCETKTTMERKEMEKEADLAVVHQRVTSNTAQMYSRGMAKQSASYNNQWANYLNNNFQQSKYKASNQHFEVKNRRLNQAISNKVRKQEMRMAEDDISEIKEEPMEVYESQIKPQSSSSKNYPMKAMKKAQFIKQVSKKEKEASKKEVKKVEKEAVDSDEDEMELMDNLMEKQSFM